jgi:hypothetical protein
LKERFYGVDFIWEPLQCGRAENWEEVALGGIKAVVREKYTIIQSE